MTRLLLSVAAVLSVAVLAVAQPVRRDGGRAPFIPPKDGNFDLFRALLHFHGVRPLDEDDLRRIRAGDYKDVIVVVIGSGNANRWVEPVARTALNNGGAVLVAADQFLDVSSYLPGSQPGSLMVAGSTVSVRNEQSNYFQDRGFPCPLPVAPDERPNAAHRLFAPLPSAPDTPLRLVTNWPSYLDVVRRPFSVTHTVAEWPPNSSVGGMNSGQQRWPFAMAGAGGERNPYRALVLADPDVLSNKMLYSSGLPDHRGAPHNWAFANRLVTDFLRDGHARTKCLFVENGQVRTDFDRVELKAIQSMSAMPQIPIPNPLDRRVQAKFAELIDNGIANVEDRTLIDNALTGPPSDPTQRRYQLTLIVMASAAGVVLVFLMVRRLFAARHKRNLVPAPTDPLFLGDETALGSFGQRRAELLRGTDFRAPVVHSLRELLAERGLPAGYARRRLPPMDFRTRGDRARLENGILDLWDVARDEALPLPYSEWKDREPILAEVHAAAVANRWRFAPTPA